MFDHGSMDNGDSKCDIMILICSQRNVKVKKYLYLFGALLIVLGAAIKQNTPDTTDAAAENDSCRITVYEKTPDCYVTSDSSGCITIANEKPKCTSKDECTIAIPGCKTKRTY